MSQEDILDIPQTTEAGLASDHSSLASPRSHTLLIEVEQSKDTAGDVLCSIAWAILWLFGLARNLASYVISLGIIPLNNSKSLLGIDTPPPYPLGPPGERVILRPNSRTSSRPSSLSRTERRIPSKNLPPWAKHKILDSGSSSSSAEGIPPSSRSLPGTPLRSSPLSLPELNSSDGRASEQTIRQRYNRDRDTIDDTTKSPEPPQAVKSDESATDAESDIRKRIRDRTKVDHSTRRILFADPRPNSRPRMPSPLTSATTAGDDVPLEASFPTSVATPDPHESIDSLISIPTSTKSNDQKIESTKLPWKKLVPPIISRRSTSDSVSEKSSLVDEKQPTPSREEKIETSSEVKTESTRTLNIETKGGSNGFKRMFRKRHTSLTNPAPNASPFDRQGRPDVKKLQRSRSPFPRPPASDTEPSSSNGVSLSLALRTPQRRITRKNRSRSNSISYSPAPVSSTSTTPLTPHPPITHAATFSGSPQDPHNVPISDKSTVLKSAPPNRSKFNPLRELEAHLYNRHGFGSGPKGHDAFEYCATPVPKEPAKRTNPYAVAGLLARDGNGLVEVTPSSIGTSFERAVHSNIKVSGGASINMGKLSFLNVEERRMKSTVRRASAPVTGDALASTNSPHLQDPSRKPLQRTYTRPE